MKNLALLLWLSAASLTSHCCQCVQAAEVAPPAPYGAIPSERQLKWHELEFYGFLHFTTNTFTDKEWGYGDEEPSVFNPTAFGADQIVGMAKMAGMRALILTCKHHDGFCLWDSAHTTHDVASSSWRDGKGDVVREISDACKRHGLKFGVYLSPWDRNHPQYARSEYIQYYRNQMTELLTNYGPVSEVWLDGANGGDGYYGGARASRVIDRGTYYDWEKTFKLVRKLQPDACIFSDAGPDVRWVGNESGNAGDPCWATYTPRPRTDESTAGPGTTQYQEGFHGTRNGKQWIPAEVDVSIRPGWFYHSSQDGRVRSAKNLMELYFNSVGHGASLLLNLPPDRRGIIHENDAASLKAFRRLFDATFDTDLAQGAKAAASNTRGNNRAYATDNVLDGNRQTYWSTDDAVTTPELILEFSKPVTFNVVSLREFLPLGQRVETWSLEAWQNGEWIEFARGTAIGNRRLWRGEVIATEKVRLRITASPVCPAISEFALYAEASP